MRKTSASIPSIADTTAVFGDWQNKWSNSSEPYTHALQDLLQRVSAAPLPPGQDPLTVMGDYLKVGDIKNAVGVALGRDAHAKVKGVHTSPETAATSVLEALTLQLGELSRQLLALTDQCRTLNGYLAALDAKTREGGETGSQS